MSGLVKCDKCGLIENKVKGFMHIRVYELDSPTTYKSRSCNKVMDVCPSCYKKLFEED